MTVADENTNITFDQIASDFSSAGFIALLSMCSQVSSKLGELKAVNVS